VANVVYAVTAARAARSCVVKFGDVVRNVDVVERAPLEAGLDRYIGLEHLDPASLHIRRWGLIEDGTSFTRKFSTRQVLFGKRRAYQRKVAVAEFDGICSGDILVFEPNNDQLLPELLAFIVQSEGFFQHALGTSAGSLSPRTRWRDLANYEFPLPPLDDQRRIAELLWAADEAVERVRDVSVSLDRAAAKMFYEFLLAGHVGNLVPRPSVALGEVADVAYGFTLNSSRSAFPLQVPYLRVANVQRNLITFDEVKLVGCTEPEIDRFSLECGDVLVVEGHASAEEVGRAARWDLDKRPFLHQNHLLRARCGDALLPEFLTAVLNSPLGRAHFRRHAKSTSGLNTINSAVLRDFTLPLPPLDEQRRICAVITGFADAAQRVADDKAQLSRLAVCIAEALLSPRGDRHVQ